MSDNIKNNNLNSSKGMNNLQNGFTNSSIDSSNYDDQLFFDVGSYVDTPVTSSVLPIDPDLGD